MTLEELKKEYGTTSAIAKALGMIYPRVFNWFVKGYIPLKTQYEIEVKTNRKFKADEKHAK